MIGHRRISLWAVLAVLFLNLVTIQRIDVGFSQLQPEIYVDPPQIKDESYAVGSTFRVSINITNADNLYGWQINMTFNPAVVNVSLVEEGPFLQDGFSTLFSYTNLAVTNPRGFVLVSCSIDILAYGGEYPPEGAYGDGVLVYITFKVRTPDRGTLLQFDKYARKKPGTALFTVISNVLVEIDLFVAYDGSFDNRPTGQNVSPIALFNSEPLSATKRGEVSFDASGSSDPDAWLVSYHWDYGDGTQEVYMREPYRTGNLTAKPIHVFQQNGTFTVTLTVKDNDDATDVASAQVTLRFDLAVVNVESPYILVMAGVPVTVDVTVENNGDFYETFDVTAYYNETLIEVRQITNMAPSTQQLLTYNWNTTGLELGNYILKANATILDEEINVGNNEYIDGSVTIASSNIVGFQLLVGGVTFRIVTNSTSVISGLGFNPSEKKLSFIATGQEGTGGFCNITVPTELLGGNYTVLYNGSPVTPEPQEATNGTHASLYFEYTHTTPNTVEIIGETAATPPIAIITASKTNPLVDELVTLDASNSNDPDGTIARWNWNFGDGDTASNEIVQHSYYAFGNFTVTLNVEDNEGYTNSTEITIRAIDYPSATFTRSPTDPLVNETVTFDATTSQPNGGSITDYSWTFGDGQTDTGSTLTHTYSTMGTFTVALTVTDTEGLVNSTSQAVTVTTHNVAITSIAASPAAVEKGGTITIQITASNLGNYTETFTVTAYYNTTAIKTESATDLNPGGEQQITIAWTTGSIVPGTYVLKAEASTVEEETKTSDNSLTYGSVTVQKITSSLSIAVSSTTVVLGRNTIIHGTLDPARSGTSIAIQYRFNEGGWATLATVISDGQAKYVLNWRPQESGAYEVQAVWQGDADTKSCQSITQTIAVQEGGALSSERMLTYGGIIAAILALMLLTVYLVKLRKK